ncbi:MAG: hypothetical protein QOF04_1096 [Solirubrobacteraceae bacterium]|jgi:hypothetical protein|nr:hypothetical protein [Solirubrobacteraceae bacterium]
MRRPLTLLATLVLALALGACGNKEHEILHGSNEGAYLDLGGMKYQVQISRVLNPNSPEDRAYLIGVDPAQRNLPAGQEWFAVFMRVQNESDAPVPVATDYTITDTQDTKFRPLSLGQDNVFAYRATTVAPKGLLPVPDSPAAEGTIQGALLLFRIPTRNLENRPLELAITAGETATVDLDI